jgi:uncharacterized protein (DUF433 family)
MDEQKLLESITVNPSIFGGKPILRGRRLAVEHVLGMLAAGDTSEILLQGYPWLEKEDIDACLLFTPKGSPPKAQGRESASAPWDENEQ